MRNLSSCLRSSAFWLLAFRVLPNQPNRSRTGFSALLAPSWIGETTVRKPRCTECRPPLGASPKYAVSSIRESTTSSASTARLRRTVFSYTNWDLPKRSWERVPARRASSDRHTGPAERRAVKPIDRSKRRRRATHRRRRAAGSRRIRSSTAATARVAVGTVDRLELLERAPRPDRHARQRRLRQVRGHLCLLTQALIEAL